MDRTKFLGASEIAAVVGMNDNDSAYSVWARKTGNMPEKESTPAMRRGSRIEPLALEDFCERRGTEPSHLNTQLFLQHPKFPHLAATLDVFDDEKKEAWEFKSTGYFASKEWDQAKGLFPSKHALQNTYQRAIAISFYKLEYVGGGLVHFPMETLEGEDFPIKYDPDLGDMLIEAGNKFWTDHVLTGVAPALTGTTAEAEAFKLRFAEATPGVSVTATEYIEELVAYAKQQRLFVKKETLELDRVKLLIKEFMGDAEELILSDGTAVTWKNKSKGNCSWKSVAVELGASPALIAKHTPKKGSRTFLLGDDEEEN